MKCVVRHHRKKKMTETQFGKKEKISYRKMMFNFTGDANMHPAHGPFDASKHPTYKFVPRGEVGWEDVREEDEAQQAPVLVDYKEKMEPVCEAQVEQKSREEAPDPEVVRLSDVVKDLARREILGQAKVDEAQEKVKRAKEKLKAATGFYKQVVSEQNKFPDLIAGAVEQMNKKREKKK